MPAVKRSSVDPRQKGSEPAARSRGRRGVSVYRSADPDTLRSLMQAHGAVASVGKDQLSDRLGRACPRAEARSMLASVRVKAGTKILRPGRDLRLNPHAGLLPNYRDLAPPEELSAEGRRWERELLRGLVELPGYRDRQPDIEAVSRAYRVQTGSRSMQSAHWTLDGVLADVPRPGEGWRLYPSVWASPAARGLIPRGWNEPGGELMVRLEPTDLVIDLLAVGWVDDDEDVVLSRPPEGAPWSSGRSWAEQALGAQDQGRRLILVPIEIKYAPRATRSHAAELAWYAAWLLRLARSAPGPVSVSSSGLVWHSGVVPTINTELAGDSVRELLASLEAVDLAPLGRELAEFMAQPPRPGWAADPLEARPSAQCTQCLEYWPEQHMRRRAQLGVSSDRAALSALNDRLAGDQLPMLGQHDGQDRHVPGEHVVPVARGCLSDLLVADHLGLLPGLAQRHQQALRERGVTRLSQLGQLAELRTTRGRPEAVQVALRRELAEQLPQLPAALDVVDRIPRATLHHAAALRQGRGRLLPGAHAQPPYALLAVGVWVAVRRGAGGLIHSAMLTLVPRPALRGRLDQRVLAQLQPVQVALRGPGLARLPRLLALAMARWIAALAPSYRADLRSLGSLQPQLRVWDRAQAAALREVLMASVLGQHERAEQRDLMQWIADVDDHQVRALPGGDAAMGWLASLLWGAASPGDVQAVSRWLEVNSISSATADRRTLDLERDEASTFDAPALPFAAGPSPVRVVEVLELVDSAVSLPVVIERAPRPVARALWLMGQPREVNPLTDEVFWTAPAGIEAPESVLSDAQVLAAAVIRGARDLPPAPSRGRRRGPGPLDQSPEVLVAPAEDMAIEPTWDEAAWDEATWDEAAWDQQASQDQASQDQVSQDQAVDFAAADLLVDGAEDDDTLAQEGVEHALNREVDPLDWAFSQLVWPADLLDEHAAERLAAAQAMLRRSGLSERDWGVIREFGELLSRDELDPLLSIYADPQGADLYGGFIERRRMLDLFERQPQRDVTGPGTELERPVQRGGYSAFGRALGEMQLRAQAVVSAGHALGWVLSQGPRQPQLMHPPGRPQRQSEETGSGSAVPTRAPRPHPGPAALLVGAGVPDPRSTWIQEPQALRDLLHAPDAPTHDPETDWLNWKARSDLYASASWRYLEGLNQGARASRLQEMPADDAVLLGEASPAGLVACDVLELLSLHDERRAGIHASLAPRLSPALRGWLDSVRMHLRPGDLMALLPRTLPAVDGQMLPGRAAGLPGLREKDIGLLWSPQIAPGFLGWPMAWHSAQPPREGDPSGGAVGAALQRLLPRERFWTSGLGRHPELKLSVVLVHREARGAVEEGGFDQERDWVILRAPRPEGGRAWLELLRAARIDSWRVELEGAPGLLPGALIPSQDDFGWTAIDAGVRALQERPVMGWPLFLRDPVEASSAVIRPAIEEIRAVRPDEISPQDRAGRRLRPLGRQREVIQGTLRRGLTLCWGPPGTGKSQTIAQALLANLLEESRRSARLGRPLRLRAVLCAPTYEAADELLRKISEVLPDFMREREAAAEPLLSGASVRLWRLSASGRRLSGSQRQLIERQLGPWPLIEVERDAPDSVGSSSSSEALASLWDGRAAFWREWTPEQLALARQPGEAGVQATLQGREREPVALEPGIELVFAGGQQARRLREFDLPADLLVIDEASQVDLPVAALMCSAAGPETRVLVSGDHRQLAPVRPLPDPDPERRSLIDWLIARGAHQIQLDTSFRSVQAVVDSWLPFGYGKVRAAPEMMRSLEERVRFASPFDPASAWLAEPPQDLISLLARPGVHIISQVLSAPQRAAVERGQLELLWREPELARDLASSLLARASAAPELWPTQGGKVPMAAVFPRRADVTTARGLAGQAGFLEREDEHEVPVVKIDTVDRFQGQEAQLVLSCPLPLGLHEVDGTLGDTQAFALEPRRLCVAFSRARRSLVIALPAVLQRRGVVRLPPHGSRGDDQTRLGYAVLDSLIREVQVAAESRDLELRGPLGQRSMWRAWSLEQWPSDQAQPDF